METQGTGSGSASVECSFSLGSCLSGPGPHSQSCSGPSCSASVANGSIGTGQSQLNMSLGSISGSGSASWTPQTPCNYIQGIGPTYFANGSQSIYADIPNGTPIRITINATLTGTGGGGASWSDAKSGAGGTQGTTVFTATAGPGKITVGGVDYYLIDTISASGHAGLATDCSVPNSQTFSMAVSLQFKVIGKVMTKVSGDGQGNFILRTLRKPLRVIVVDGETGQPQSGVPVSFVVANFPTGAQGQSVGGATSTNPKGLASAVASLGDKLGAYKFTAACPSCAAGKSLAFNATAISADSNDPNNPAPPKPKGLPNTGSSNSGGGPNPPPPPGPPNVTVSFDKPTRATLRVQYGKSSTLCATVSPASESGKVSFVDVDGVFALRYPFSVPGCSADGQVGIEITSRLNRCVDTGRIEARLSGTAQAVGTATGAALIPNKIKAVRKTLTRNDTFNCNLVDPPLLPFCIFHGFNIELSGDSDMDLSGLKIREWKYNRTHIKEGGRDLPFCEVREDKLRQELPIQQVRPGVFGIGDANGSSGLTGPVSNCGSAFNQDISVGTCKFVNEGIRVHVGPPFSGIPGGWGDISVTRPDE